MHKPKFSSRKYALDCEHGYLASACRHCRAKVAAANSDSRNGWESLIKTKERQYAGLEELAILEERRYA